RRRVIPLSGSVDSHHLSRHDALPIYPDTGLGLPAGYTGMPAERERTAVIGDRDRWLLEQAQRAALDGDREIAVDRLVAESADARSEEHTSELQSRQKLVCRLVLVKKK